MSAARLSQLLASGGVTPGNIRPLAELCGEWYKNEPGLTTFVLRAIFGEMDGPFSDPQGVPAAVYDPFHDLLLPELTTLAQLLPHVPEEQRVPNLQSLVRTFQDCRAAAGW